MLGKNKLQSVGGRPYAAGRRHWRSLWAGAKRSSQVSLHMNPFSTDFVPPSPSRTPACHPSIQQDGRWLSLLLTPQCLCRPFIPTLLSPTPLPPLPVSKIAAASPISRQCSHCASPILPDFTPAFIPPTPLPPLPAFKITAALPFSCLCSCSASPILPDFAPPSFPSCPCLPSIQNRRYLATFLPVAKLRWPRHSYLPRLTPPLPASRIAAASPFSCQ